MLIEADNNSKYLTGAKRQLKINKNALLYLARPLYLS